MTNEGAIASGAAGAADAAGAPGAAGAAGADALGALDGGLRALVSVLRARPVGDAPAQHPTADFDDLGDAQLVDALRAITGIERSLEQLKLQCSSAIARRSAGESRHEGLAGRHGYSTPERFIAATTGSSTADAAKLLAVAKATTPAQSFGEAPRAPRYACVAAAIADGAITIEAANRIIEFLDSMRADAAAAPLLEAETKLVERAAAVGVDQLWRYIKYLRAELDACGVQAREEELWAQRSLRMWEDRRGLIHLRACLDPATAAPIKAAVDALVSADLHAARDAKSRLAAREAAAGRGGAGVLGDAFADGAVPAGDAGARGAGARSAVAGGAVAGGAVAGGAVAGGAVAGGAVAPAGVAPDAADRALMDSRGIEQMAADALADLVRLASSAVDAPPALSNAAVVVRIDQKCLMSDIGFATIDGIDEPVSPATARMIAASAGVIPMVLGGPGEVLDLGRRKRFFTKAQRIALAERDGGCAHPDCARPVAHTQAHHRRYWEADDGPTDLDNGVLLCAFHHWCMHHDGWEVFSREGRTWFVPPRHLDPQQRPRPGRRATRLELQAA
ncbi:HNH endonuclease signature motif containing protein [Agromyces sp. NPDC055520]